MTTPKRVTFNLQDEICPPAYTTPTPESSDEEDNTIGNEVNIEMSEFMQSALVSRWNVFSSSTLPNSHEPAFVDRTVQSIVLEFQQSFIPGQFEARIREGAPFIRVKDIYRAIHSYLDTEVETSDVKFQKKEPRVQQEIQLASKARTRRNCTGHVKHVDFLGRNRLLKGISVNNARQRWLVKFGPEEED